MYVGNSVIYGGHFSIFPKFALFKMSAVIYVFYHPLGQTQNVERMSKGNGKHLPDMEEGVYPVQ